MSNPSAAQPQAADVSLDSRLKSLRIERGPSGQKPPGRGKLRAAFLVIFLAIAAGASAYFFLYGRPIEISAAPVQLEESASSGGSVALAASGYVVAHHRIAVGSKVMGRVSWIGVEKGDRVKADQVLVRLEDEEFRAQVAEARANTAVLEARLDQLKAGSRPEEIRQASAAVRQAEAGLRNAEQEYSRIEQLHADGVVSRADLDRALAQRDAARAALEYNLQSSLLAEKGPRLEEIRAAEAQLDQARAALEYSQTQLRSTEIRAPVSGTVLQRMVERGEMVTPSGFGESGARTSVVSLADLQDLQIELDISQTDFARLRMGQKAEIIPEAFPTLRYSGYIAEIAPQADRAKATVQVKVKVENPDDRLLPEMNARVNFLSEQLSASSPGMRRPKVHKAAVVQKDGSDFVFVVKADRVEQRVIRRADEQGDFYVVIDGLSGGEVVAISNAGRLSEGSRVRIVPE